MNNIDHLRETLTKLQVLTIVCSRLPLLGNVENLMNVISDGINVYPPLSSQMRSWKPPKVLLEMTERNVKARMCYVVRIDKVKDRNGKKFVHILYQTYETYEGTGGKETMYEGDYFTRDAEQLSIDIVMSGGYAEFKVDIKVKRKEVCETGLVVQLSFVTMEEKIPRWFSGHNHWKLESINTWPVCDVPIPEGAVLEGDGFHGLVRHLGQAIFEFLRYYEKGRYPM